MDDLESYVARAAKTNAMRLSAILVTYPVEVAVIDCEAGAMKKLCYERSKE